MHHHGAGLRRLKQDAAWIEQLKRDWREASLTSADRTMLGYVEKLTLRPWEMTAADVDALRAAGFDDTAILDINQVTGYYAFRKSAC